MFLHCKNSVANGIDFKNEAAVDATYEGLVEADHSPLTSTSPLIFAIQTIKRRSAVKTLPFFVNHHSFNSQLSIIRINTPTTTLAIATAIQYLLTDFSAKPSNFKMTEARQPNQDIKMGTTEEITEVVEINGVDGCDTNQIPSTVMSESMADSSESKKIVLVAPGLVKLIGTLSFSELISDEF